MQAQLRSFASAGNDDPFQEEQQERFQLQVKLKNADAKVIKYRLLLNSPIYYAAVLISWLRWEYFEEHLTATEYSTTRDTVQELWDESYKN